jgi:transposase-like protein
MFTFTPPAQPLRTRTPCPHCGALRAVPVYATSTIQYFRCARCRRTWDAATAMEAADDHDSP